MKAEGLFELASFLETLPEPHILCDRDYRIVAANAAYRGKCAHFAEVLGKTCYEVSHRYTAPCDQAGEACPLARSLLSGQRERAVHLHYGSGGELYESIDLSPVRNTRGEITHFVEKLEEIPVAKGLAHAQGLVGRSPSFQNMLELVARVAKSDATVLLQGESGTGKELVAQAIHDASTRSRAPFVVLDCSGCRRRCSKANCSAMSAARSPGHRLGATAWWRRLAVVRCSGRGGRYPLPHAGETAAAA